MRVELTPSKTAPRKLRQWSFIIDERCDDLPEWFAAEGRDALRARVHRALIQRARAEGWFRREARPRACFARVDAAPGEAVSALHHADVTGHAAAVRVGEHSCVHTYADGAAVSADSCAEIRCSVRSAVSAGRDSRITADGGSAVRAGNGSRAKAQHNSAVRVGCDGTADVGDNSVAWAGEDGRAVAGTCSVARSKGGEAVAGNHSVAHSCYLHGEATVCDYGVAFGTARAAAGYQGVAVAAGKASACMLGVAVAGADVAVGDGGVAVLRGRVDAVDKRARGGRNAIVIVDAVDGAASAGVGGMIVFRRSAPRPVVVYIDGETYLHDTWYRYSEGKVVPVLTPSEDAP
ncbi:MAG: hypothetical protein WC683_06135 [bacterium]